MDREISLLEFYFVLAWGEEKAQMTVSMMNNDDNNELRHNLPTSPSTMKEMIETTDDGRNHLNHDMNPVTPGGGEGIRGGGGGEVEEEAVSIEERFVFPPCPEPTKVEIEPIEIFVAAAISSQHPNDSIEKEENDDDSTTTLFANHYQNYRVIANSLRRPEDPLMLLRILIALRTADKGISLYRIACYSNLHAQLLHLILKLNPFEVPVCLKQPNVVVTNDDKLLPYHNYSLADAYMHLLIALISANTIHVIPAMTSIWKVLTQRSRTPPEPV